MAVDAQFDELSAGEAQISVDWTALGDVPDLGVASMRTRAKNLEGASGVTTWDDAK